MHVPNAAATLNRACGKHPGAVAVSILFLVFVVVYAAGGPEASQPLARLLVPNAWQLPFSDTLALTAATECYARGADVFRDNYCDVANRPHIYSPLWLWLGLAGMDRASTLWVGLGFCLAGIAAMYLLPVPGSRLGRAVMALALLSPPTFYVLERANIDLVIYVLAILAARAAGNARPVRAWFLALAAGLLKFYPLTLFALLAHQPVRRLLVMAGVAAIIVAAGAMFYAGQLALIFAAIPRATWSNEMFGAVTLPAGIAHLFPNWALASQWVMAGAIGATVAAVGLLQHWLPRKEGVGLPPAEHAMLLAGAVLVCGCFLSGQSFYYRAVFLQLTAPGLLALARAGNPVGFAGVALAVGALWAWVLPIPLAAEALSIMGLAMWLLEQAIWWALVALLLAIIFQHVRSSPIVMSVLGDSR